VGGNIPIGMTTTKTKRGRMTTVREFRALSGDEQQCGEQLIRQRWLEQFAYAAAEAPWVTLQIVLHRVFMTEFRRVCQDD
jgi:hypothetical protein